MARAHDSNRQIAARALGGAIRMAVRSPLEFRFGLVREGWSSVKRFGAHGIRTVDVREVPCIRDAVIEGYIDDPNRPVLAALCEGVGARRFFEIGTNRGRTAWTVAHNNPDLEVITIDLPPDGTADENLALAVNASDSVLIEHEDHRGDAIRGSQEAERITQLWGDSAEHDFSPYEGQMDVVFIDGAHSYAYVKNDTELARRLVAPGGTIVWDDYPAIPGVYRLLTDIAPQLTPAPFHIKGTRLVVHSDRDLVEPLSQQRLAEVTEA